MIEKMSAPKQIQTYPNQQHWQPRHAAVQCALDSQQTACLATEYYPLRITGRVDYTNFSQDYQYHGKKLPTPKPIDTQLTLERVSKFTAATIQIGDVIQLSNNDEKIVTNNTPVRVYHEISTRAISTGQALSIWQRWHFTRFLKLTEINRKNS